MGLLSRLVILDFSVYDFLIYRTLAFIIKTSLLSKFTFGFANGMALYPFILVSPEEAERATLIQHEKIHIKQQLELLVIPFYLMYILEFSIRFYQYGNWDDAYRNISFEREAYAQENNEGYLMGRKRFSWSAYFKS